MTIADYWREIERTANVTLSDEQRALGRALYFAGAMAALHELTGWDPDVGVQVLALNPRSLTLLCRELSEVYYETSTELYAEMVRH